MLTRWIILILSLLLIAGCAEPAVTATPVAVLSTATITPTVIPSPTATASPTSMPTPVADSRWVCDPSGGVACFAFLNYVTMLNRNEGWAFGQDGVRLHYAVASDHTEPAWQSVQPLDRTYGALSVLDMVNDKEGWAVIGGYIFHLRNDEWEKVWERSHINDLFMLNEEEGWAVGDEGIILHYQQGIWEMVSSPTQNWLNSVAMVNREEGWAVGDGILHYTNQ